MVANQDKAEAPAIESLDSSRAVEASKELVELVGFGQGNLIYRFYRGDAQETIGYWTEA